MVLDRVQKGFHRKNLNAMADEDQFLRITYFVNGGFNGLADRFKHLRDCF